MAFPARVRFVLALLFLGATAVIVPAADAAPLTRAEITSRANLLTAVNRARTARGLRPVRMARVLNRPSVLHSQWLARTGRLTHTGRDGRPFYYRLYRNGFPRSRGVGENLGMIGGCSLREQRMMVRMWLMSPNHRRNLLNPRYRYIGVAVTKAADCRQTVYTTAFGE